MEVRAEQSAKAYPLYSGLLPPLKLVTFLPNVTDLSFEQP